MELERMKKEELISVVIEKGIEIDNLKNSVKDFEHLAKAVEAKDSEISRLHEELEVIKAREKNLILEMRAKEHLAKAVESKDAEINSLKQHLAQAQGAQTDKMQSLQLEIESLRKEKSMRAQVDEQNEKIRSTLIIRNVTLNKTSKLLRNVLQSLQASIDMGINAMVMIEDEFKPAEPQKEGVKNGKL